MVVIEYVLIARSLSSFKQRYILCLWWAEVLRWGNNASIEERQKSGKEIFDRGNSTQWYLEYPNTWLSKHLALVLVYVHTLINNLDYLNSQLSKHFCMVQASLDNRGCTILWKCSTDQHKKLIYSLYMKLKLYHNVQSKQVLIEGWCLGCCGAWGAWHLALYGGTCGFNIYSVSNTYYTLLIDVFICFEKDLVNMPTYNNNTRVVL